MKKRVYQQGQSLVEILAAFAVMVIVLMALLSITTTSIKNASFSRHQARATELAQRKIEEARSLREKMGDLFFVEPPPADCAGTWPEDNIYTITRTCSYSEVDTKKMMEVVVTVDWTDGKDYQSKLTTILTNWQ